MTDSLTPSVSSDNLRSLKRLKAILDYAVSDGKLCQVDMQRINAEVYADGRVSPEEAELYRSIVIERFKRGELEVG